MLKTQELLEQLPILVQHLLPLDIFYPRKLFVARAGKERSRVWQNTLVTPPANLGFIVLAKKRKGRKIGWGREPFSESIKGLKMRSIINQNQQGDPSLTPVVLVYMLPGCVIWIVFVLFTWQWQESKQWYNSRGQTFYISKTNKTNNQLLQTFSRDSRFSKASSFNRHC